MIACWVVVVIVELVGWLLGRKLASQEGESKESRTSQITSIGSKLGNSKVISRSHKLSSY